MRSSCRSELPLYLSLLQHVPLTRHTEQDIRSGAIETVLARNGLPEGGSDLVALIPVRFETNDVVLFVQARHVHTGQSEDEPGCLIAVSISHLAHMGGTRTLPRRTISRMLTILQGGLLEDGGRNS